MVKQSGAWNFEKSQLMIELQSSFIRRHRWWKYLELSEEVIFKHLQGLVKTMNELCSNNLSAKTCAQKPTATGFQIFIFPGLHRAFTVVVYNEGTLLGLFGRVFANIH